MRRRDFLALAGASVVAWPTSPSLSQTQTKRLAFINSFPENDPAMAQFLTAARQGLASQGWVEGRNLEVKYWFQINVVNAAVNAAKEAVNFRPDVVITVAQNATKEMGTLTQTIPIVCFAADPVTLGLADTLSRPGRNVTGFTQADASSAGKLTELLKELSPATKRVAAMVDSSVAGTSTHIPVFMSTAIGLGMAPSVFVADSVGEISDAIDRFGPGPEAGFVGLNAGSFVPTNHAAVTAAVVRNKMPAVHGNLVYQDEGTANYYIDNFDAIRKAGEYAGLILNGSKVVDLPIQAPDKYILTVNLKSARLINLQVPQSILVRADRVIE